MLIFRLVDKVIHSAISQHLFGDGGTTSFSSDEGAFLEMNNSKWIMFSFVFAKCFHRRIQRGAHCPPPRCQFFLVSRVSAPPWSQVWILLCKWDIQVIYPVLGQPYRLYTKSRWVIHVILQVQVRHTYYITSLWGETCRLYMCTKSRWVYLTRIELNKSIKT